MGQFFSFFRTVNSYTRPDAGQRRSGRGGETNGGGEHHRGLARLKSPDFNHVSCFSSMIYDNLHGDGHRNGWPCDGRAKSPEGRLGQLDIISRTKDWDARSYLGIWEVRVFYETSLLLTTVNRRQRTRLRVATGCRRRCWCGRRHAWTVWLWFRSLLAARLAVRCGGCSRAAVAAVCVARWTDPDAATSGRSCTRRRAKEGLDRNVYVKRRLAEDGGRQRGRASSTITARIAHCLDVVATTFYLDGGKLYEKNCRFIHGRARDDGVRCRDGR